MSLKTELPRIVDAKELALIVPYSQSYLRILERDGKFPKRIALGPRRVGWRLSEIERWIADREQGDQTDD